jgi:hypothetical protein
MNLGNIGVEIQFELPINNRSWRHISRNSIVIFKERQKLNNSFIHIRIPTLIVKYNNILYT